MKLISLTPIMLALLVATKLCAGAPAPLDVGSKLEPFVDTYLIDQLKNASHKLHEPVRREVVMEHDEVWEGNTSTYHTVFKDGDKFKMYYRATHNGKAEGGIVEHAPFVCYAESTDGIHWTKPKLGLIEYKGSKDNNIVLGGYQAFAFAPFIDTNPTCKPDERYKAITVANSAKGLMVYKSPDGLHWSPLTEQLVIPKAEATNSTEFDTLNLAFWDAELGQYFIYFRRYRPLAERLPDMPRRVRDVVVATSPDLINWGEQSWLKYPGAKDEELYTNGIKPYYRAPHIRIGLMMRYTPSRAKWLIIDPKVPYMNGTTDVVLISSRDGKTFNRSPEAYIRPGLSKSSWSTRSNLPAWGILETTSDTVERIPEISLYASEGYYHGKASRLRRFTIRVDGFGSVNAGADGGEMLTKPLRFRGDKLFLNYSTSVPGSVRVEVQDEDGKPIPGLSLEDCNVMYGDELEEAVSWKGGRDLAALAGKSVRLRFVLNDADLYAIQFK